MSRWTVIANCCIREPDGTVLKRLYHGDLVTEDETPRREIDRLMAAKCLAPVVEEIVELGVVAPPENMMLRRRRKHAGGAVGNE